MMAALRCTAPMKAPEPPPTMPIFSFFMLFPSECRVEGARRRLEVQPPDEGGRLPRPLNPVHAGVLPLHRERTVVAYAVQSPDYRLEIHTPAPDRSEVPAPAVVAESEVRGKDAALSVESPECILDVGVVDTLWEAVDELHGIDELPVEVAGIEVEPESLAVADCFQRPLRGVDVVGDLGGVDLEGEPDALRVEDIEYGVPPLGEVSVPFVHLLLRRRREEVELVPDGGTGEARHDVHSEPGGGPGGVPHLLSGPLSDPFRISIPPDVGRQGGSMALIYGEIAHGLTQDRK